MNIFISCRILCYDIPIVCRGEEKKIIILPGIPPSVHTGSIFGWLLCFARAFVREHWLSVVPGTVPSTWYLVPRDADVSADDCRGRSGIAVCTVYIVSKRTVRSGIYR